MHFQALKEGEDPMYDPWAASSRIDAAVDDIDLPVV
jgi:hypothetical protein